MWLDVRRGLSVPCAFWCNLVDPPYRNSTTFPLLKSTSFDKDEAPLGAFISISYSPRDTCTPECHTSTCDTELVGFMLRYE